MHYYLLLRVSIKIQFKFCRQDLLGKETELVQSFRETEQGLNQLDEVDVNHLDAPLETAHRLLHHLENQQPRVVALQNEINHLRSSCTEDESRILDKKSKELDQTTQVINTHIYL